MAQFIDHYRSQGVDHIYILDNGSTDGFERLPECGDRKFVTIIRDDRDGLHILTGGSTTESHRKLLTENLFVRLRNETQWAIIVDMDEFMFGKNGYTLCTYVRSIPEDVNRVYVFWNVMSPPAEIPETFSLQTNTRRINYDQYDKMNGHIRFANTFGKSIFRTQSTDLAHGLWIHKVFVHGRAVTNYGDEDTANTFFVDEMPYLPVHSEEAYRRQNVTLHHYCIRNRSDYDRKTSHLPPTVDGRVSFIVGLLDLIHSDDASGLTVQDTSLAAAPVCSLTHVRPSHVTLGPSIAGHLDMFEVVATEGDAENEGRVQVRIVGWSLCLARGGSTGRVRFAVAGDGDTVHLLETVRRNDIALVYGKVALASSGWTGIVVGRSGEKGSLEIEVDEPSNENERVWVRFMDIFF